MIIKSLIAAAFAASALAIASPATRVQAGDVGMNLNINFGGDISSHYGFHALNPGHISCQTGGSKGIGPEVNLMKTVNCKLPDDKYTAWRKDNTLLVGMSRLF